MAKLVEEGERAMGIAQESEWLKNMDGAEGEDGEIGVVWKKRYPDLDTWKNVNFQSISAIW